MKFLELTSNARHNKHEDSLFLLNVSRIISIQPSNGDDYTGTWIYCEDKPNEPFKAKEDYDSVKIALDCFDWGSSCIVSLVKKPEPDPEPEIDMEIEVASFLSTDKDLCHLESPMFLDVAKRMLDKFLIKKIVEIPF